MPESLHEVLQLPAEVDLRLALTHRSWTEENPEIEHNERLEYLGDAVLELTITEFLFERLPEAAEGDLSRIRGALVRTESLAALARRWELGEHLRLGRGELASGGRDKDSLLANAVEAVLGAVFLASGYALCRQVVRTAFGPTVEAIEDPRVYGTDPKNRLQELAVQRWKVVPRYREVGREGPAHDLVFTCQVTVGEHVQAQGQGSTKKAAQSAAASAALKQVGDIP